MKIKNIILFVWGFLAAGAAFAQYSWDPYSGFGAGSPLMGPVYKYITVQEQMDASGNPNGNVWIRQSSEQCQDAYNNGIWYRCVMTMGEADPLWNTSTAIDVSKTAEAINSFFKTHKNYTTAFLNTDFDFGQLKISNDDTSCVVNHTPLKFGSNVKVVDFQNSTISNLCLEYDVSDPPSEALTSIGFLDSLNGVTFKNATFSNVHFAVKNSSAAKVGVAYPPVGTVTGAMDGSSIENVKLIDVSISGPHAGGLVGRAWNSDIHDVLGDDDVMVSNDLDVKLTSDGLLSRFSVYLGGVAGIGYDLKMKDVDMVTKVYENVENDSSAVGGLVGGYMLSKYAEGSSEIVLENLKLPKKTESTYTKIQGGTAMGGIFGDVSCFGYFGDDKRPLTIENSSFYGRILNSHDNNFAGGGFIGRVSSIGRGFVKIVNSQSELMFDETVKNEDSTGYYVGGFIGKATYAGYQNTREDDFVSILNSSSKGSIRVTDSQDNYPAITVLVGGLVGAGAFAFNGSSLVEDTSSMQISVDFENVRDSLIIGGLVGHIQSLQPSTKKVVVIDKSVFNGSISFNQKIGPAFVGGLLGLALNNSAYTVEIRNSKAENEGSLIVAGASDGSTEMAGLIDVGGIFGNAESITKMENVSVTGDIVFNGTRDVTAGFNIGGFGGKTTPLASNNFELSRAFFNGTIVVPQSLEPANVGYMFGFANLAPDGKAVRRIVSTYHWGQDSYDAFGNLFGLSQYGTDWKSITNNCAEMENKGICMDVQYNVRNGSGAEVATTETNNGVLLDDFIKSAQMYEFLNKPFSGAENAPWAYDSSIPGSTPYLLNVDPYAKPNPPASSSSEESSSSVESSSSEESSSSITPEPPSSSSEESSSSITPEPPSSSSEESSSSSEKVIAKFVKPTIESNKVNQSGALTDFAFGVKVDSTAGKVSASIRIFKGSEIVYEGVVMDSVPATLNTLPVSLMSLPAGKLSYEFILSCDSANPMVKGEFVVKEPMTQVASSSWQMISIADLDFESLVLDERNSLYWWDEFNEFGDYWQYQAYNAKDQGPETRGYWFGTFDGAKLNRKAVAYAGVKEIVWNLDSAYSGWNMVANPFAWVVDISELADSIEVWNWNGEKGTYEQRYELQPYEAVWVKASGAKELRFAAMPKYDGAASLAKKTSLFKVGDGWTMRATLYDEFGKEDSWNMFGVNSTAFESEEPPSAMGDYVSFSFMDGKRALAKSFKQSASEMEWTARLSATSERDAFLKLDGVDEAIATGNKVFFTIDGKTTEMTEGKSVRVKLGRTAKTATIRVAPAPRAKVEYALKGVRAIHNGNNLNVQFSVTDGLAGAPTKVELVGLDGRVVASASAKANAGSNMVTVPVPDHGLYVLRVRAGSQVSTKNILLK